MQASKLTLCSRAFYNSLLGEYEQFVTSFFGFDRVRAVWQSLGRMPLFFARLTIVCLRCAGTAHELRRRSLRNVCQACPPVGVRRQGGAQRPSQSPLPEASRLCRRSRVFSLLLLLLLLLCRPKSSSPRTTFGAVPSLPFRHPLTRRLTLDSGLCCLALA